jgi:hypothetical protein
MNDIPLRAKNIELYYAKLHEGFMRVQLLRIKNEAEAIIRTCNKELCITQLAETENNIPLATPNDKFVCRFCNLEFDNERGVLAHESVKHKEQWKQVKQGF